MLVRKFACPLAGQNIAGRLATQRRVGWLLKGGQVGYSKESVRDEGVVVIFGSAKVCILIVERRLNECKNG